MAVVYLALGSNVGHREQHIAQALNELPNSGILIDKISSVIENDPVGGPPQGKFLNAVLKGHTDLAPLSLLSAVQKIEHALGRVREVPNGPRTIDIDILLYDQMRLSLPTLTIPHPRMLQRKFVMDPLNEIDPQLAEDLRRCAF